MEEYIHYLLQPIPEKNGLKLVKTEAQKYDKGHTPQECQDILPVRYQSENFQIQEVGVFLAGYVADRYPVRWLFAKYSHPSRKLEGAGNTCYGI